MNLDVLILYAAIGVAGAAMSPIVLARRWGFVCEGLGHSGVGGAGIIWIAATFAPALAAAWVTDLASVAAVLITGFAVSRLTARGGLGSDAAIGVFLVASLAIGFMGQRIFNSHFNSQPPQFLNLLFGDDAPHGWGLAMTGVAVAAACVLATWLLSKEILAWCTDEHLARTAGVHTVLLHYLMMALMAIVVAVGVRTVGGVLITAVLLLPAATASRLARSPGQLALGSCLVGVGGSVVGSLLHEGFPSIPAGPAVVLTMVAMFAVASNRPFIALLPRFQS